MCRLAIQHLSELKVDLLQPDAVSQQMFLAIRDFLMTEICILNAHRSGVIANLTLDAFYKSTFKEDLYILSVKQHKTYGSAGSAKIILEENLYEMLETYVTRVRPIVTSTAKGDSRVFVSWNGAPLSSSSVSAGINSIWQKTGMMINFFSVGLLCKDR